MEKIIILAPAKLNLYLNVGAPRADGYHSIESVMQTVSLFDRIEVRREDAAKASEIQVRCNDFSVPNGEDNIVFRAAEAFFEATGICSYRISFRLDKKIPAGTGLGGGSSDAAAAILALNRLYKTELPTAALCEIGVKVGADVPFCVKRGTCLATGIGEILESITPMPDCGILIAVPKESRICTKEAYGKIDAVRTEAPSTVNDMAVALQSCDIKEISAMLYNRFEEVTPGESGIFSLMDTMKAFGAVGVRMSGSGPAVFGLFPDLGAARAAKEKLDDNILSFVCEPIRREYTYIES